MQILNSVVLWSFLDVGGSFVCTFFCCVWNLNAVAMVFERLPSLQDDCASAYVLANNRTRFE